VDFPPDLRTFVDEQHCTFEKTMPKWPHLVDGVPERSSASLSHRAHSR